MANGDFNEEFKDKNDGQEEARIPIDPRRDLEDNWIDAMRGQRAGALQCGLGLRDDGGHQNGGGMVSPAQRRCSGTPNASKWWLAEEVGGLFASRELLRTGMSARRRNTGG